MKSFKQTIPQILLGLVMMGFITHLILSFSDDQACIEKNTTENMQKICQEWNEKFKALLSVAWIIYLGSIGLHAIISYLHDKEVKESKQSSNSVKSDG